MSIKPEKAKEMMGQLEVVFPRGIPSDELEKKFGANEMVYCKKKRWIQRGNEDDDVWYATPKGMDASLSVGENSNKKRRPKPLSEKTKSADNTYFQKF